MNGADLVSAPPAGVEPVRRIPTDDADDQPEEGMALCLSGGGYRAMLFHLGGIWRLNELNLLATLKRVSSVSGGSITAGRWQMILPRGGGTRNKLVEDQ